MNCKQENEYLQDELESLRREQSERDEREYQEQQRRREQRRQDYEDSLYDASTWEEAFRNGLVLIGREAAEEKKFNAEMANGSRSDDFKADFEPINYFENWEVEVEQAQVIYREEMRMVEEQIKKLRLDALVKIADKVAIIAGESDLVKALRENNPEVLTNW